MHYSLVQLTIHVHVDDESDSLKLLCPMYMYVGTTVSSTVEVPSPPTISIDSNPFSTGPARAY